MAEGGVNFPTVLLIMGIKDNKSEPVTPAVQKRWG